MEKIIISIAFLTIIFGCQKSNTNQVFNLKINQGAIQQVLSENDVYLQKSMYRALNENERFEIWNKKFEALLSSGKLNIQQAEFITFLKNTISPSFFKGNTTRRTLDGDFIKNKGIELFGVDEAFKILASLSSPQSDYKQQWNKNCSCSHTSQWCGNGTCPFDACNESSLGCGSLLAYACNGICQAPILGLSAGGNNK